MLQGENRGLHLGGADTYQQKGGAMRALGSASGGGSNGGAAGGSDGGKPPRGGVPEEHEDELTAYLRLPTIVFAAFRRLLAQEITRPSRLFYLLIAFMVLSGFVVAFGRTDIIRIVADFILALFGRRPRVARKLD